jgi:hypothetical protein
MRKRTAALIVLGAFVPGVAGVALATPPTPDGALKSELLARGAAGEFRIHDESMGLKMQARQNTDVAVVRATLVPGGSSGWHGHPGPSMVIVKTGALTMREPRHRGHGHHDGGDRAGWRRCSEQTFAAGTTFVHPEHEHEFVNETDVVAEFYVIYMVPAGAAPLLNDVPIPPRECS